MKQYAEVVESKNGVATIEIRRHSSCDDCGGCLGKGQEDLAVEASNPIGAKPGEVVSIELPDKNMMGAVFMVYLLPLVNFFIGYYIGEALSINLALGNAELVGAGVGIFLLLFSFILVRKYGKHGKQQGKYQPVIKKVVDIDLAEIEKANQKKG